MSWRRVPGSERLAVHPRSGRDGALLQALTGASDWRRDLLDHAGAAAIRVAGAALLPQASQLSWPPISWEVLDDELSTGLPGLRLIGAATPRQAGRPRLSLLGRMTGSLVVVKLGRLGDGIGREGHALQLLLRDPIPGIATPEPLSSGTIRVAEERLDYLVTTSIALRHQRAAIDEPLRTFESDLGLRLSDLPALSDDVDGLVPVHGDLTPWNLRRTPRGLALFDWEAAGWGLPGSDLACYRSASDVVRRPWSSRPRRGEGA